MGTELELQVAGAITPDTPQGPWVAAPAWYSPQTAMIAMFTTSSTSDTWENAECTASSFSI